MRFALRTFVSFGLVCLASAPALAQRDPAACFATGVGLTVSVFGPDGVTPLAGSASPCGLLQYRVRLHKAVDSPDICAFYGGTLMLTTPDGAVHVIPPSPVPCIGGDGIAPACSPGLDFIESALIPYAVSPADIVGGLLTAVATYSGGIAHDSPTGTPGVAASTPKFSPAQGGSVLGACADTNRCTIDLCDAQLGCVHLPSKRCLVASPLGFKLSSALGTVSFKRQGSSNDAGDYLKVTLQEVLLTSLGAEVTKQKVKVNALISGPDAAVASLLYPVVALGAGDGALAALQAQGYDVAVTGALEPCTSRLPADTCATLAKQLAQAIDTQLALGDAVEKDTFRQGIQALGYLPDQCCVPTTCAALNANCGSLPDGCGGTLECGTCTLPLSCGGGGVPNHCGIFN